MSGIAELKEQDDLTGRAKVRFFLIDPVVAVGMRRKRGVSEDDHKIWLAKLADDLSYLTPRNLKALQSFAIRWAGGTKKNVWPEKVSILNAAYMLQPIPSREHEYAKSVIRSKMGRDAHEGGYLLELFEVARKWGPPPNKYVLSKLGAQPMRTARAAVALRSNWRLVVV